MARKPSKRVKAWRFRDALGRLCTESFGPLFYSTWRENVTDDSHASDSGSEAVEVKIANVRRKDGRKDGVVGGAALERQTKAWHTEKRWLYPHGLLVIVTSVLRYPRHPRAAGSNYPGTLRIRSVMVYYP